MSAGVRPFRGFNSRGPLGADFDLDAHNRDIADIARSYREWVRSNAAKRGFVGRLARIDRAHVVINAVTRIVHREVDRVASLANAAVSALEDAIAWLDSSLEKVVGAGSVSSEKEANARGRVAAELPKQQEERKRKPQKPRARCVVTTVRSKAHTESSIAGPPGDEGSDEDEADDSASEATEEEADLPSTGHEEEGQSSEASEADPVPGIQESPVVVEAPDSWFIAAEDEVADDQDEPEKKTAHWKLFLDWILVRVLTRVRAFRGLVSRLAKLLASSVEHVVATRKSVTGPSRVARAKRRVKQAHVDEPDRRARRSESARDAKPKRRKRKT
jgi:hypothetical protein